MDHLLRKIVKNSGIILTGNVAASALGLLSFAIMARDLGPELLAYFALAQAYTFIFNSIFNVQTWESLIKFGQMKGKPDRLAEAIKTNVVIDIVGAILAFVIAVAVAQQVGSVLGWDSELVQLSIAYCFTIPFTLTTLTIGVPRLFDKFGVIAKFQFVTAVVKLGAITIIFFKGGGVLQYTLAYIGAEILVNSALMLYSLALCRRKKVIDWWRTRIRLDIDQIRFLWWTNLRTIVRIPVRQLDVFIINQVMSMDAVGIYKAYKEIISIIGRLGEPVNQALYPEYSKLLGQDQSTESVAVTKRLMKILGLVSAATCIGFLVLSAPLIEMFLGAEYLELMAAYYILVVFNCISLFLTPINSLFIAAGFARYSFIIVLLNNILYLAIALIGGIYLGIYGVVLAFAAQTIFNKAMKIALMRRHSTGWGSVIR